MMQRIADWHGVMAARAYCEGRYAEYRRHARLADALWRALA